MSRKKQESLFWGVLLMLIGVLFLLDNFGVDIDLWHIIGDFWPMILIAIGLKNIWYHFNKKRETDR
jgi:lia operon protein LiaF